MKKLIYTTTAAAALMLASAPAMAAWEPTKPVEIVVAAGAGGASDQMARMIQAAVQKNNLMKQPLIVTLKGGASGAEALMYMKSSDGDPNRLLLAYSLIYMLPLSAKIPFNWRELSPVAVTAFDEFVLWDNTTMKEANVKDFVAAAKGANPPFKMGELSLLPAVRKAPQDALIVADGTSCRHQIHGGSGRDAMHVSRVLAMSLDAAQH